MFDIIGLLIIEPGSKEGFDCTLIRLPWEQVRRFHSPSNFERTLSSSVPSRKS